MCCCRNMWPASTWLDTTTSTVTPSGRNSCHREEGRSSHQCSLQHKLQSQQLCVPAAAADADSHGWQSSGTVLFHCQRLLCIRSRKPDTAALKEVTPGLGPTLSMESSSAQNSCKGFEGLEQAAQGHSGTHPGSHKEGMKGQRCWWR